jgi:hypothetical protein
VAEHVHCACCNCAQQLLSWLGLSCPAAYRPVPPTVPLCCVLCCLMQIPKRGRGAKGGRPVNRDRFISKMFLRGDSVILVLRNPK